jgi:hypothetical protein
MGANASWRWRVRSEFSRSSSVVLGQSKLGFFLKKSLLGSQGMTMGKNLYVGNLSFKATADDLRELFSQHGTVTSAQVIMDRETGKPRGFGFVEMADGAQSAVDALNGQDFQGRPLTVNEARPREDRRSGGGGGGGGGRGGRGGGYGNRY